MATSGDHNKVRFGHDGHEYHFLWAARACLRLLPPTSTLVGVGIEGVASEDDVACGLLGVDMSEYEGNTKFRHATRITYTQYKHSTTAPNKNVTASSLKEEKVLEYFGGRYLGFLAKYNDDEIARKIRFQLITNRPISRLRTH